MRMKLLEFWCPGRPSPKGSWDPIVVCVRHNSHECGMCSLKDGVRTYMSESDASKRWQRDMALAAQDVWRASWRPGVSSGSTVSPQPFAHAVRVEATFYYVRPKRDGQHGPITKGQGDIDKLVRGLLDALTKAGVYADDRQVVQVIGHKRWAPEASIDSEPEAGVYVEVWAA